MEIPTNPLKHITYETFNHQTLPTQKYQGHRESSLNTFYSLEAHGTH